MAWRVTADPQRFDEAIDWFRNRVPVTDETLRELTPSARRRAFRIAGVAQLEVVSDVYGVLLDVIATGAGLDEFKRRAKERLESAWKRKDAHRIETIYRTNAQSAYNAGRFRELNHPAIRRHRPYLFFDAVLDGKTSPICRDRNGKVLERNHPWWDENQPPLHHRCRSAIRALTRRQAEARGITDVGSLSDLKEPGKGFGAPPSPDDWQPDDSKYPPELWALFTDKQDELL